MARGRVRGRHSLPVDSNCEATAFRLTLIPTLAPSLAPTLAPPSPPPSPHPRPRPKQAAAFKGPADFARHLSTPVEHLGCAAHRPRSAAPPEGCVGAGVSNQSGAAGAAGSSQTGERQARPAKPPSKKEERAKAARYAELKQRQVPG